MLYQEILSYVMSEEVVPNFSEKAVENAQINITAKELNEAVIALDTEWIKEASSYLNAPITTDIVNSSYNENIIEYYYKLFAINSYAEPGAYETIRYNKTFDSFMLTAMKGDEAKFKIDTEWKVCPESFITERIHVFNHGFNMGLPEWIFLKKFFKAIEFKTDFVACLDITNNELFKEMLLIDLFPINRGFYTGSFTPVEEMMLKKHSKVRTNNLFATVAIELGDEELAQKGLEIMKKDFKVVKEFAFMENILWDKFVVSLRTNECFGKVING